MTIWVLYQALTAEEETRIEERKVLALPFGDLPDLSRVTSEQTCRHLMQSLHPELPPESIARKVERVWKYYSELQVEDMIAVPLPLSKEAALARITERYNYEVGAGGGDLHQIAVEWYPKRLPPRLMAKYASVFAIGSGMAEVENEQARIAIREQLPHSYNRFVKWKWLLGIFFALGMLRMAQQMFQH